MKLYLAGLLTLTACASRAKFIDMNESPRGGRIELKYGALLGQEKAEKDAEDLMTRYCAPRAYSVQNTRLESTGSYQISSSNVTEQRRPVVTFVCK